MRDSGKKEIRRADQCPFGAISPMATIAKYIKDHDQNVKIVFIGPCTAKKAEVQLDDVKPYVDAAITFDDAFLET